MHTTDCAQLVGLGVEGKGNHTRVRALWREHNQSRGETMRRNCRQPCARFLDCCANVCTWPAQEFMIYLSTSPDKEKMRNMIPLDLLEEIRSMLNLVVRREGKKRGTVDREVRALCTCGCGTGLDVVSQHLAHGKGRRSYRCGYRTIRAGPAEHGADDRTGLGERRHQRVHAL